MALLRAVIVQSVLAIQNRRMKDPQHAFLVVLANKQMKAVPNATEPHAKRAPLTTLENVIIVHKVGHRKSWMPRNAPIVIKAPQHRMVVEVRCVSGATLVHLVVGKAFAKHAPLGFIKIPKVNKNAVTLVPRLEKYPTKNKPGADCHRGALANHKNI